MPHSTGIPDELRAALDQRPDIAAAFATLPPSHQREYAQWVDAAKKPATRVARAERAVELIAQKRRSP